MYFGGGKFFGKSLQVQACIAQMPWELQPCARGMVLRLKQPVSETGPSFTDIIASPGAGYGEDQPKYVCSWPPARTLAHIVLLRRTVACTVRQAGLGPGAVIAVSPGLRFAGDCEGVRLVAGEYTRLPRDGTLCLGYSEGESRLRLTLRYTGRDGVAPPAAAAAAAAQPPGLQAVVGFSAGSSRKRRGASTFNASGGPDESNAEEAEDGEAAAELVPAGCVVPFAWLPVGDGPPPRASLPLTSSPTPLTRSLLRRRGGALHLRRRRRSSLHLLSLPRLPPRAFCAPRPRRPAAA